jgi:hypothetical protein
MFQQKMKKHKSIGNKHKDKYQNFSDSDESDTETGSLNEPTETIAYRNLVKEIADLLYSIVLKNKKNKKAKDENSPFVHKNAPSISIYDYLLRILNYTKIDKSTLIISLIYIDKICLKKEIALTKYNVHRILFSSILIAIKYNEDKIYDNLFYSKVAGISLKEINVLENKFLKIIDFDLFISKEVYEKYYNYLNNDIKLSN